uniref:Uncharacterized protein LOC114348123 n=1 Tax=Diabrotica virgifera virgifera TaxID=50390 RepID=A0A6P7GXW1_DIAVI
MARSKKKIEIKKKNNNVRQRPKRTFFQYEPQQVKNALEAIRGGMKVSTACNLYEVPRSTIRNKLSGRAPETSGKVGRSPVLGKIIEDRLVHWIKTTAKMGFPICREGLYFSIKKLVEDSQLKTPFKANTPGRKWFHLFMRRFPELSLKQSEYINRARSLITEEKIRNWFKETLDLLGDDKHVLDDPARIWNMDETSFYLCPKGGLILAEKGLPVYNTSFSSDKENITTLITANALGKMAPPLTLFKYDRLPEKICKNIPRDWGVGKSPKGWMTSKCFYEYFSNVFIPFIHESNIALPIIVFLDGHSSYLSLPLCRLCIENKIIVVCLHPNTTHILQPLDVSFFFPLKSKWKTEVKMYRFHNGRDVKKHDIPQLLQKTMDETDFIKSLQNGFKTCGLFPFSANNVDYSKITLRKEPIVVSSKTKTCLIHLKYLESKIHPDVLKQFKQSKYDAFDESLYNIWVQFKNEEDLLHDPIESVSKLSAEEIPNHYMVDNSIVIEVEDNNVLTSTPTVSNIVEFDFPEYNNPSFKESSFIDNATEMLIDKELAKNSDVVMDNESMDLLENSSVINKLTDSPIPSNVDLMTSSVGTTIVYTPKRRPVDLLSNILIYPSDENISKKTRKREILPSVLTCNTWLELAVAKEKEKELEMKKKEKKKQDKEAKRACKEENLKKTSRKNGIKIKSKETKKNRTNKQNSFRE